MINICDLYKKEKIMTNKQIKQIVKEVIKHQGSQINEINIVLCKDDLIRNLNKQYRKVDELTDVLAFELSNNEKISGEVIISLDRAKAQAKEYNHTVQDELMLLIVHGILHLCGYRDDEEKLAKLMRAREEEILAELKKLN